MKAIIIVILSSILVMGCISTHDQKKEKQRQFNRKMSRTSSTTTLTHDTIGKAVTILKREEGYSALPYYDSKGYVTVGYGLLITKNKTVKLRDVNITLSEQSAAMLLHIKVKVINDTLEDKQWYKALTGDRRAIVISMVYQMGFTGFYEFTDMLRLIKQRRYEAASMAMLDSKWFREDSPSRAERHSLVMRGVSVADLYGAYLQ